MSVSLIIVEYLRETRVVKNVAEHNVLEILGLMSVCTHFSQLLLTELEEVIDAHGGKSSRLRVWGSMEADRPFWKDDQWSLGRIWGQSDWSRGKLIYKPLISTIASIELDPCSRALNDLRYGLSQWRSSRTYIPCAHDYGRSQSWRPCIKSAGGDNNSSREDHWRPSVHIAGPPEGDSEKPHINCIRVPASYSTTWKETSSPPFRPSHRYIPATAPERRDWKVAKGHLCSRQCVHKLQDSAYIHGQMFDDTSERITVTIPYLSCF